MRTTSRRATIAAVVLALLVGIGIGFIMGDDFNFDTHSYMGGVSFVMVRLESASSVGIDPLQSCRQYVSEGMPVLDGYPSERDFLRGCEDAVRQNSSVLVPGHIEAWRTDS